MSFTYPISSFTWNSDCNTLCAEAKDLWYAGYNHAFPNNRRMFTIMNERTGNWRVFKFVKTKTIHFDDEPEQSAIDIKVLIFKSEDDIMCEVLLTN